MTDVTITIETSPLVCSVNLWTGFYMIGTSVMKELGPLPHRSENSQFSCTANMCWFLYDENTVENMLRSVFLYV